MCGTASWWAKLACIALICAFFLFVAGFATVSWMVYRISGSGVRVGLFQSQACVSNTCTTTSVDESFQTDAFKATKAFEIMALILYILLPVMVCLYVYLAALRTYGLAVAMIVMCFIAALFTFIGMICWLAYIPDPYVVSYSMGLTVMAAILAVIAGLLLIPDTMDDGYHPTNNDVSPSNQRFRYR